MFSPLSPSEMLISCALVCSLVTIDITKTTVGVDTKKVYFNFLFDQFHQTIISV